MFCSYGLPLEIIRTDFKSGLEDLLKEKPTKGIFLGTRNGDPNAVALLNDLTFCNTRSTGWAICGFTQLLAQSHRKM
jgi:hypothetical protein